MKTYAYINDGVVQQIIEPVERLESDRPPAPAPLPNGATADQIAVYNDAQAAHDNYQAGEIPLSERYAPGFVDACVDITNISPRPAYGWTYHDGVFAPWAPTPPTPAEILASNTSMRNQLLAAANLVIPALQDAVDLEDPSANPALLLKWKQFRVAVNKIDLTQANPLWPVPPQPGYGAALAPADTTA